MKKKTLTQVHLRYLSIIENIIMIGQEKISPRGKCLILHQIPILREQYGSFTIKRLRVSIRVRKVVSDETVGRVLRGAGYQFLRSRKKGLLEKDNLKKRRKFARKITKILTDKFWEEGISFYIDAAGC